MHGGALAPSQIAVNRQASIVSGSIKGTKQLSNRELQYFQTLAQQKLGNKDGNESIFNELVTSAALALNQTTESGANNSQVAKKQNVNMRIAMAHYISGLGYSGLGNKVKARAEFNSALAASPDFLDAKIALNQL
jgi:hypothetical protein